MNRQRSYLTGAAVAVCFVSAAGLARATDVVGTPVAAENFTTLVAALKASGLIETREGSGPFAIFAPTDASFAAPPAGTVETLLKPEKRVKLASTLTDHVLPGRITSKDVAGKDLDPEIDEGQLLAIDADGGAVNFADATVTNTKNGVIDAVLPPKM